jgi:hypothetical protein
MAIWCMFWISALLSQNLSGTCPHIQLKVNTFGMHTVEPNGSTGLGCRDKTRDSAEILTACALASQDDQARGWIKLPLFKVFSRSPWKISVQSKVAPKCRGLSLWCSWTLPKFDQMNQHNTSLLQSVVTGMEIIKIITKLHIQLCVKRSNLLTLFCEKNLFYFSGNFSLNIFLSGLLHKTLNHPINSLITHVFYHC